MKKAYRTRREAEAVRRLRQQGWADRLRVYQHKGWWYLTSMSPAELRALRERKKNDSR